MMSNHHAYAFSVTPRLGVIFLFIYLLLPIQVTPRPRRLDALLIKLTSLVSFL